MANGNGSPFYQDFTVTEKDGTSYTIKVQLTQKQAVIAALGAQGSTYTLGAYYDSMGNEIPPLGMGGGGNMTGPGPSQGPSNGGSQAPSNGGNGSKYPEGGGGNGGTKPADERNLRGQGGGFDDSTTFAMLFAGFSTLGAVVSGTRKKKKR